MRTANAGSKAPLIPAPLSGTFSTPKIQTMRIFSFLFTLLIAMAGIGILSCHEEEPDPNHDYRLFTCHVNGAEWKPRVDFCLFCPPDPRLYADTGGERSFTIVAARHYLDSDSIKQHQTFRIQLYSIQENNEPIWWHAKYLTFNNGDCAHFRMDTTYSNVIKITRFDGVYRGILKGEFEFRLVSEDQNCTDTLQVTEGRFDFRTDL